jgi:hypothetical protein
MDPFSLGIAAASAGLSFFGKQQESQQALSQRNRQIRFQNRQARENTRLQNLMIADRNRYAAEEYQTRVNLYNQQKQFNADAANLAFQTEQQRLNEQFTQTAFQRSGLQRQMLEAAGANVAMGFGRGRSFERASALSTRGEFGRSMAQLNQRTADQRAASISRLGQISQQQYARDLAGYSSVAMRPYMQRQLPAPMQMAQQRSSGFNTMLQIGNAALTGAQIYGSLAAPDAGSAFGTNDMLTGPSFSPTGNPGMTGNFNYSTNTAGLSSIGSGNFSNPLGF